MCAEKLLTRDDFRNGVMARSSGKCVVCKEPATASHHIIERRLFDNGGYYLSNGAALCDTCHIKAEETTYSVEDVRAAAGIVKATTPDHLYDDTVYTKWGDAVQPRGERLRGELFHDESVQKILKQGGKLGLYTNRVKFPRTYHFEWSPGKTDDDRTNYDLSAFEGKEVVVSLKVDGENFSGYRDGCHARSLDSRHHSSRDWAKTFLASIAYDIPENWRICCENLYAKHSIYYKDLPSYLMLFSVWNEMNECLDWDQTVEWGQLLGITTVPVLYEGVWDEKLVRSLLKPMHGENEMEGYVVRTRAGFRFKDYRTHANKCVRDGHVQTSHHWARQAVEPNGLKK